MNLRKIVSALIYGVERYSSYNTDNNIEEIYNGQISGQFQDHAQRGAPIFSVLFAKSKFKCYSYMNEDISSLMMKEVLALLKTENPQLLEEITSNFKRITKEEMGSKSRPKPHRQAPIEPQREEKRPRRRPRQPQIEPHEPQREEKQPQQRLRQPQIEPHEPQREEKQPPYEERDYTVDQMIAGDISHDFLLPEDLAEHQKQVIMRAQLAMSWEELRQFGCAVCELLHYKNEGCLVAADTPELLQSLHLLSGEAIWPSLPEELRRYYCVVPDLREGGVVDPIILAHYKGALLSRGGVKGNTVFICSTCESSLLKRGLMPIQAISNGNAIGWIPPELQDTTEMERRLVARRVPKAIMKTVWNGGQTRLTSHTRIYDANLESVAESLPNMLALETVHVVITTTAWDHIKANSLMKLNWLKVRPVRVAKLIQWLASRREDYQDILDFEKMDLLCQECPENRDGFVRGMVEKVDNQCDDLRFQFNHHAQGNSQLDGGEDDDGIEERSYIGVNDAVSSPSLLSPPLLSLLSLLLSLTPFL
jgi:hypothetical protein